MKLNGKFSNRSGATGLALAVLLAGTAGCGAAGSEYEEGAESEPVRQSTQALGSTKPLSYVNNWNDLKNMVSDGNYRLTTNIDASGKTWTPKNFTGTFDGNGRTISNLTINVSGDAGFFYSLNNAIVTNVKFTNLSVTGTWVAGGLAAWMTGSAVDRVVVEGTISVTSGFAVGGIFGEMIGGTLYRSYSKGTVTSVESGPSGPFLMAGGLVGFLGMSGAQRGTISETYAQTTVSPSTSVTTRTVYAGGLVGSSYAADIYDVLAIGDVTGRGSVGGLVGYLGCDEFNPWLLYKGIYRGDVVDKNAPSGGWAGTVGDYEDCFTRWDRTLWDNQLDPSSNWHVRPGMQDGATTAQLRSNTVPWGGVYGGQNDNGYSDPPWSAGNSNQHHTLRNIPGPNTPPR